MDIAHLSPSDVADVWICFAPLDLFSALEILQACFGLGGLFGQQRLVVIIGIFNNMS